MTVELSDLRRRFPPEDADAYALAYAEAALAEELGTLVHGLRVTAHLDVPGLAARMEVDEEEVLRAEEGDPSLSFAFVDRLARAVGAQVTVTAGGRDFVLGAPQLPPPAASAPAEP
ncbi:MAG: hypothetical protein M0Z46_00585 [Actinomycetota bacterium]|jgi:hypothetical protein|nr:hypothetical protein [Actinomycetota bacterium]